ncbi:hypothetical protein [Bosea sp. (in: a-proteobacteria)]|uniref:hypothetical protein n=1 Tax=Bosea sp. (in: a-proteobacteria) TaxID=1871050 RepID=UPI002E11B875
MIAVLGMPCAFAAWGFEVARRLAQASDPSLAPIWVDRMDAFAHDEASPLLVCSQFPPRSLRRMLRERRIPLIVFVTNGMDALRYQRQLQPVLLEAVRTVGASVALIGDCDPQQYALLFDATDRPDAGGVVRAMASHIGLAVTDDLVAEVLAWTGPIPTSEAASGPAFTMADEGIVTLVLENGVAHLRDAAISLKSVWPHRVFFAGDRPNEEAPLVIDATGGSRVLYYGPYFHLAEGRWRAQMTLGFTKEAVGLPLKVLAYGPGLLGEARIRPLQEGIFAARFTFTVSEPEHPVEFHVRTEEGAIEGRIALGQAELSHLGRALPSE